MSASVNSCYVGDAREGLRAMREAGIVAQTCVTSPPYYGLRDYGTASWEGGQSDCSHRFGNQVQDSKAPGAIASGVRPGVDASACKLCGARRVDQQIGLEKTSDQYIASLVEVFRGVRDVLADDGTLWLNIGDSYNAYNGNRGRSTSFQSATEEAMPSLPAGAGLTVKTLKNKDLIGIPWMLAFALRADGWYLRQDVIWHKPNAMPESVRDRCTKAHEYLFLLSKSERYYFDSEAMQEPASFPDGPGNVRHKHAEAYEAGDDRLRTKAGLVAIGARPTRNRRSVWTIPTQPYSGAHFATFPPALIEPCILAGSRPGNVVLDPFLGSGTTAMVSERLGRRWIGCELNPQYARLIAGRASQRGLELVA